MTSMRTRHRSLIAVLSLAVLSSCSGGSLFGSDHRACTLIGCAGGLQIQLAQPISGAYRVELFANATDSQPLRTYDCPGTVCSGYIVFYETSPASAVVRVTSSRGVKTTQFASIVYTSTPNPNGPDCGPPCTQATVTADVPV
jgi:hypothetical protein